MERPEVDDDPLQIHVLDVGHGDSLVLELPGEGDRFGVIDCHKHEETNRRGYDDFARVSEGEPKALTFFRALHSRGRRPVVEFACLTHPHADHYNGFASLLKGLEKLSIPIRRYWDFGYCEKHARLVDYENRSVELELTDFLGFYRRIRKMETDRVLIYQGLNQPTRDFWRDGEVDLAIDVIAPNYGQWVRYSGYLGRSGRIAKEFLGEDRKLNDNIVSSALLIRYGAFRAVLGGDVPNMVWEANIPEPWPDGCHVLKLSHHGSKEGNRPAPGLLCQLLGLRGIAVISGGYRANLQSEKTRDEFEKQGHRVFSTGADPTVVPGRVPSGVAEGTRALWRGIAKPFPAKTFHGNITISGFRDGRYEVKTECMPT